MSTTVIIDKINVPLQSKGAASQLLFWTRRVLQGLLILLLVLSVIGAIYQVIVTARDARAFPAVGQLVDVGGYKLHLHCMGEGSPTVILESGQANSLAVWAWVQ